MTNDRTSESLDVIIGRLRHIQEDLQSGNLPQPDRSHWTVRAREGWIEAIENSVKQLEATREVRRENWLISAGVRSLDYYGVEETQTGQTILDLIYALIKLWRADEEATK